MFSRPLLLVALLALTSCGGLPRPFEGNPGAIGLRLAQPPPSRLAVLPATDISLSPQQSADLAAMLADSLRDQDVPAIFTPPQPGDWRLVTSIARFQGQVVPMFTVLDPQGEQSGVAQGLAFTPEGWAGDGALRQAASNAAPNLASLLTRIEAQRRASDPASLSNRPTRLRVPDVTGAPGDGNRMLARRMREQLNLLNLNVLPEGPSESADFTIAGQVLAVPIAGKMVRVEIQWILTDSKGEERSRVVQLNEVPAGTVDKYWGDVALVVAQEAAGGVKDLITQQTAGTKPTP